jgi:hypothetical protein
MPRKTFTAGEVLAAADVNTFLMDQSVMTFADSTARASAIGTATEGMLTYLEDTNSYEYWDGSAYVSFAGGIRNPVNTTNTAAGTDALNPSGTGQANTAFGSQSLALNATGSSNTGVGFLALSVNTDGLRNTAIGANALRDNTTATDNTAIGQSSLLVNTTGIENTTVGRTSLSANTTGGQNTAIGNAAGNSTTTGNNNSFLGFGAVAASATTSNSITLGNSSITSLRCQVTTISSLSDQRDKKEIKDLEYGLDLINRVRPVEFTWDTRDGSINGKPDIGFIAQELAQVEDSLNDTDRLRLTLRDNPEKLEATPGRLLPIAIKAIQELSAQNIELIQRLEKLENR